MNAHDDNLRDAPPTVAVVYGGRSGEHEVSLRSASAIMEGLAAAGFNVLPLLIGKDGRWHAGSAGTLSAPDVRLIEDPATVRHLPPDATDAVLSDGRGAPAERIDVVFPMVHGTGGEDGALQGLMELAGIPYVGCGIAGSAVGMDKVLQKRILRDAGIPVAPWIELKAHAFADGSDRRIAEIESALGYPCFVKPANAGSSVGVSKAHHRKELMEAITLAFRFDDKVIVEFAVPEAREIECAVLGNGPYERSVFGEIVPSNEFYDYAAKYLDEASELRIPAPLPAEIESRLGDLALRAAAALDVAGMARVDFLVAGATGECYLNEINTLPGFTEISMYPKLWEASGLQFPALLSRLVTLALERHRERGALVRDFAPFLAADRSIAEPADDV